jgi:hypothetical protein
MLIDVKLNPRNWSLLATAIIKEYHRDKQKNRKDAYINKEWYNTLLLLANRFANLKIKELE